MAEQTAPGFSWSDFNEPVGQLRTPYVRGVSGGNDLDALLRSLLQPEPKVRPTKPSAAIIGGLGDALLAMAAVKSQGRFNPPPTFAESEADRIKNEQHQLDTVKAANARLKQQVAIDEFAQNARAQLEHQKNLDQAEAEARKAKQQDDEKAREAAAKDLEERRKITLTLIARGQFTPDVMPIPDSAPDWAMIAKAQARQPQTIVEEPGPSEQMTKTYVAGEPTRVVVAPKPEKATGTSGQPKIPSYNAGQLTAIQEKYHFNPFDPKFLDENGIPSAKAINDHIAELQKDFVFLPPKDQARLGVYVKMQNDINQMKTMLNNPAVAGIKFWASTQEEADFRAISDKMSAYLANALSGGAIPQDEYNRLYSFLVKFGKTRQNNLAAIKALESETGSVIGQYRAKPFGVPQKQIDNMIEEMNRPPIGTPGAQVFQIGGDDGQ